jgi:hypothetical protein
MQGALILMIYPNAAYARTFKFGPLSCTCTHERAGMHVYAGLYARTCAYVCVRAHVKRLKAPWVLVLPLQERVSPPAAFA